MNEARSCPACGRSAWSSIERFDGGSRRYELRPTGWAQVGEELDLFSTTFTCASCGFEVEAGGDL